MKEERTVKIGQLDVRATILDGELEYLKIVAKKATLTKEESVSLRDWLDVVLGRSTFNVTSNLGVYNSELDKDLYDGGAIPLEQRSASTPLETSSGLQVNDMSDKLETKQVVKFTIQK